ncbi:MAG: helix-turn-helix domain-containing protein [Microgenomates group bacterium]
MPDITFRNSPITEKVRWKSTRLEVANGWFENHGFLVVPELKEDASKQIQVIYPKEFEYVESRVEEIETEWKRVEESFWEELDHYLPEARIIHKEVVVDIGRIGTISSCYWTEKHYYLRVDRSIGDLAAMIINRVLFVERNSIGLTWSKRESLMDFIMTRPAMKKLFPKFDPVFHQLSKVPPKMRKESKNYVRSLGIAPTTKELEVKNGKILINGVVVAKELTKQEKEIMKQMIKKTGEIVTYDELADIIWGEGEFKTFWALNKMMQRLRNRLSKLDIESVKIEVVRGQGYLLR